MPAEHFFERYVDRPCNGLPALFLDRDGVLNEDLGYVGSSSRTIVFPEALTATAEAHRAGIPVLVVTNQSGIGRGYYNWAGFIDVMELLRTRLKTLGGDFDAVLATSAVPEDVDSWRKPGPGMLKAAEASMGLALSSSWMVGDQRTDKEAAKAAGLHGFLYSDPHHGLGQDKLSAQAIRCAVRATAQ